MTAFLRFGHSEIQKYLHKKELPPKQQFFD